MQSKIWRGSLYLIGLVLLALGIIMNTKSEFGITPIVSVPFTVSYILKLNFGNASFAMYGLLWIIECIVLWKNIRLFDLLQMPFAYFFTRLFNFFGSYLPNPGSIYGRVLFLVFGIIFTGVGAAMSMNARLVMNPGDGIVMAFADRFHQKTGFIKNILDCCCVAITILIGILALGRIYGVGIGTVAAMIFVGRVMAVYNHFCLEETTKRMGLSPVSEKEEKENV